MGGGKVSRLNPRAFHAEGHFLMKNDYSGLLRGEPEEKEEGMEKNREGGKEVGVSAGRKSPGQGAGESVLKLKKYG